MKRYFFLAFLVLFVTVGMFAQVNIFDAGGRIVGRLSGDNIFDAGGRTLGRISGNTVFDAGGRTLYQVNGTPVQVKTAALISFFFFQLI